jgi:superfamily II DNA/RNA helicase
VQVAKQAERLAQNAGIPTQVLTLLGGSPYSRQAGALKKNPSIVIGTPGRTSDLVKMGNLKTQAVCFLVLDEAQRLVDKEYLDALEIILQALPQDCVKVLASATSNARLLRYAKPILKNPLFIELLSEGVLAGDIEHWIFYVEHRKRIDFIRKFEAVVHPSRCLVFAEKSDRVTKITERLIEFGLPADSILARQDKEHRRVALERFATGKLRYLVTSDLGARGLDIPEVSHSLSLDFPEDTSLYVHRAGRTGRAGKKGVSVVLADGMDIKRASRIAVERGFVFRTRVLSDGAMFEPPVEEFFDMVGMLEEERFTHKSVEPRSEAQGKPPRG